MQQRAGLLFLSIKTQRILLILENEKWTVPTFSRNTTLLCDAESLMQSYSCGKIIPIELYLSEDRGFEYGTYVCAVKDEFLTTAAGSIAWCDLDNLPKLLHNGLKSTLTDKIIRAKIDTILELEDATIRQ
jgi:hypothetical protein